MIFNNDDDEYSYTVTNIHDHFSVLRNQYGFCNECRRLCYIEIHQRSGQCLIDQIEDKLRPRENQHLPHTPEEEVKFKELLQTYDREWGSITDPPAYCSVEDILSVNQV